MKCEVFRACNKIRVLFYWSLPKYYSDNKFSVAQNMKFTPLFKTAHY
jgi:hypothetical protein